MNEERIKEVFADEVFVKDFWSKETPEEAQALLAEKDIDVSVEELVKIRNIVERKLQATENGEPTELTEEELADIAGGAVLWILMGVLIAATGVMMAIPYVNFERRRW